MKVNIKDLRAMINRMLDFAEEKLGSKANLEDTNFFVVMFDKGVTCRDIPEPTLADLRDDVEYVLESYYDEGALSQLDYEKMGNIIKALGYKVYHKNESRYKKS